MEIVIPIIAALVGVAAGAGVPTQGIGPRRKRRGRKRQAAGGSQRRRVPAQSVKGHTARRDLGLIPVQFVKARPQQGALALYKGRWEGEQGQDLRGGMYNGGWRRAHWQ